MDYRTKRQDKGLRKGGLKAEKHHQHYFIKIFHEYYKLYYHNTLHSYILRSL